MAPFPVERAMTARIPGIKRKNVGITVSTLVDFPVRGLVFEAGSSLVELADAVGQACMKLQDRNIPFNLLIVDRGARVFLLPQQYAEMQEKNLVAEDLLDTQVNPACFEISGHIVLKRAQDFEDVSEEFICRLLAECSLPEGRFKELCKMCLQ